MKRSPLLRKTPLRRTSRLRPRSKATEQLYVQRRAFVREFLTENPRCQIAWDGRCRGRAEGVHEVVKRSHGGAIIPGPKADAQGQRFMAACHPCNQAVEDVPAEARRRGFA